MTAIVHPQQRITGQHLRALAERARAELLTGEDLADIAADIDWNDQVPDSGFARLVDLLCIQFEVSAQFLIDETAHYLGWEV